MHRLLGPAIAVMAVVVGIIMFDAGSATAGSACQQTDPATGRCLVWIEVPSQPDDPSTPGNDGPRDTGAGQACFWDPKKQGLTTPPAGPVPCTSEMGYWSNSHNCYVKALNPQPPAGDPLWQGHEPSDGAVYSCFQPQTGIDVRIWSQNPPPGSGTGPSPREVAQIAIDQMELRAVDIGMVPETGDDHIGIVGMPVWMWVKNPTSHTYGPITASASAGGITIAATARVLKVTWDMGDGTKIACASVGTPYKASFGNQKSPDCGHVYEKSSSRKQGDKYTVTATSEWVVSWEGAGQTGTIRLNGLTRTAEIAVGEAQVLVQ